MTQRIGKYRIGAVIGRSAPSVAYLAHDEFLNADLALEAYSPDAVHARTVTADAQFVTEAVLAG
jgi:serine/threonine protein kinase